LAGWSATGPGTDTARDLEERFQEDGKMAKEISLEKQASAGLRSSPIYPTGI